MLILAGKSIRPFKEVRSELEKQYEYACYKPESGLDKAAIKALFEAHRQQFPDEELIVQRAFLQYLIFTRGRIAAEKDNLFAGKVEDCGLMKEWRSELGKKVWEEEFSSEKGYWSVIDYQLGIGYMIDTSHIAPDWESVLRLGLPGLQRRAASGHSPLHRAAALLYDGAIELCRRCGKASDNQVLLNIAERAPQTLYEAFQLALFFHDRVQSEGESVRSMGRFDQLYLDFYRRDMQSGYLNRDSAAELLKYFWIAFYAQDQGKLFGKNFCFGPEINELSRFALEIYDQMDTVDPKLSIRVSAQTPPDFLCLAARNIRNGRNGIVFLNDRIIITGLIKHGRAPADAQNYIPIGCYEPAVAGKEVSLSGATHLILPAALLHTLNKNRDYPDFDALLADFKEDLRKACRHMARQQSRCEKIWPLIAPVPFLSGSFADCLLNGKDITEGGNTYNSTGCVVSYFADMVDSLAAIQELVYRQRACTLADFRLALHADWQGYEKLQRRARHCPKWGNNDDQADGIGVEMAAYLSPLLSSLDNGRGGKLFPSIYGQLVVERGEQIGALPSGRNAGKELSKNMGSCIGMDKNGITSLMNSVLKIDMSQYPCGTCLDLMLHPSSVSGDEGLDNLVALIRAFLARGGSGLQFNIFGAGNLREAQKNPEKYANLQVRVCGWNARFVELSVAAQETFIRQAEELTV